MTPFEYQDILNRWRSGNLTLTERRRFWLAGCMAERNARDNDRSLIPPDLCPSNIPIQQVPEDVLVAVGFTAIALASITPGVAA